jgi:glycosyltransferase involved in cell wall biosynthesis
MTVAEAIAERYRQELGLNPLVVMNAPQAVPVPTKTFNPQCIRLVHHGVAFAIRKPAVMIETLALCDARYTLHFMLMPSPYVEELKQIAAARAPGRVFFYDAVAPEQIVPTIADYDIGFNFIAPTNYNYLVCLPNKFFESINAGLAICTGPSPAMAEIVQKYGCGVVAPSFEPQDLAAVLNQTTAEQWIAMQQAAREAAKELNATHEMAKVVQLYARLFAEN